MSFLGQTNSSGMSNVLNDLSAMLSDMADNTDAAPAGATNATPSSGANANNGFASQPQNMQLPGDGFGSSQPNPMHAVGLILEGLGELMQMLGEGQAGGSNPSGPGGNDPLFNSFNATDTGDPHLSFTGTQQGGAQPQAGVIPTANAGTGPQSVTDNKKWDDMNGQQDMLHADINGGRYQLSTDVTTPVANGATLNKSAGISFGADSVNVDNQGNVMLKEGQVSFSLPPGQSYTFADSGLQVSNSADGKSLTATMDGANGQNISTTITQAGNFEGQNYLNISSSGNNVNLGGYMVDQAAGTQTENTAPVNYAATPNGGGAAAGGAPSMASFLQQEMRLQQQNESNFGNLERQVQNFAGGTQAGGFGNGANASFFNAINAMQTNDLDFSLNLAQEG